MTSDSFSINQPVNEPIVLKPRLNIFDYDRSFNTNKTKKNLKGIDKELYEYLNEPVKSIDPIQYWQTNKDSFP